MIVTLPKVEEWLWLYSSLVYLMFSSSILKVLFFFFEDFCSEVAEEIESDPVVILSLFI